LPVFCYITDRLAFAGDESARRRRLLGKIAEAASCGVDYIQLREKDLPVRELESLAREAVRTVRETARLKNENRESTTALLINSRTDVALTSGADGVHLRSDDLSPLEVRAIWCCQASAGAAAHPVSIISVSCHSRTEVEQAAEASADFAVFAPVFEKKDSSASRPAGLELLREACGSNIPVLALGGVTLDRAQACLDAGAAGIAAIRLFQDHEISQVLGRLRG
jgi:thiamine-phosphate pyrophosphorylase